MITFRVELCCDGCGEVYLDRPSCLPLVVQRKALEVQRAAEEGGWITDSAMHFCPKCQVQRKAG